MYALYVDAKYISVDVSIIGMLIILVKVNERLTYSNSA
jgi:hypothetical protein